MILVLLFAISIFFAMNMGASGLGVSFAPSIGSDLIKKNKAVAFFTVFVFLGSLFVGDRVARTLSGKIIPAEFIDVNIVLIVLFSACISLFLANMLKIPQSTSIAIVSSLVGAGIYFRSLNIHRIAYLLMVWIGVSIASYFTTYFIAKRIYPPNQNNLRFYEKFFSHKKKLVKWVLFTDFYSAFGIGTNNVANVVGPLLATGVITSNEGFLIFSLAFGLGSFILGKGVLNTVSKEIVPIGVLSASIISLVVSTLIVTCSLLGLPAPYVQFSSLAILAIYTVKEESNHSIVLVHPITKKILKVWIFTPLLSILVTILLLLILGVKK